MKSNEEIKTCPFCGCMPKYISEEPCDNIFMGIWIGSISLSCCIDMSESFAEAGYTSDSELARTEEEAKARLIKRWNTRAPQSSNSVVSGSAIQVADKSCAELKAFCSDKKLPIEVVKNKIAIRRQYASWEEMENWYIDNNMPANIAVMLVQAMTEVAEEYIVELHKKFKGHEIFLYWAFKNDYSYMLGIMKWVNHTGSNYYTYIELYDLYKESINQQK